MAMKVNIPKINISIDETKRDEVEARVIEKQGRVQIKQLKELLDEGYSYVAVYEAKFFGRKVLVLVPLKVDEVIAEIKQ